MRKCAPVDESGRKKLHTRIMMMEKKNYIPESRRWREKKLPDDLNYTPAVIKTQCAALNYVVGCNKRKIFCELYTRAPTLQ